MAEKLALLTWFKALLAGLILSGLTYLAVNEDSSVFEAKRSAATKELEAATKNLRQTEDALRNAVRFEAENKAMQAQFKGLVEFLPNEPNLVELMRTLTTEAKKSGADVSRIDPQVKAGERSDFYETSKIDIQMKGTYSQLVLFLSYLTHVPRLLTFEKMELSVDALRTGRITFVATLVAYRYVGLPGEHGSKDGHDQAQPKPN